MKAADGLSSRYSAQYERRVTDTDAGSLLNANHRSQSSRSPSNASLLVLISLLILHAQHAIVT